MRKLAALGVLLLTACPAAVLTKPPKSPTPVRIQLPSAIDEQSYTRHRQIYDALPSDAPQRAAFRQLFLRYLVPLGQRAAKAKDAKLVARTFKQAATLYDPAAVFDGVTPDPALVTFAQRVVELFSRGGDEMQVVPALCVQLGARPTDRKLRDQVWQILKWVDRTAQLTYGRSFKGTPMIRAMERASQLWPSSFVLDALRKLYVERMLVLAEASPIDRFLARRLPDDPFQALLQTGYKVVRLYLRVDRTDRALEELRKLSSHSSADEALRKLLEDALSPSANVEDVLRLAEHVEEHDADVALRVCRANIVRFPAEARIHACVGRLATMQKQVYLSVIGYERAVALAPRLKQFSEALANQYQRQLFDLIADEQLEAAKRQLPTIERFYKRAEQLLGTSLTPSLGRVHYAMGHGLYNAGQIGAAVAAFRKSVAAEPAPEAMIHLATIYTKSGIVDQALRFVDAAEKLPMKGAFERVYWSGRIEGLRAGALAARGDAAGARKAHQRATRAWQLLLSMGLRRDARAEVLLYQARSLYAGGDVAGALQALEEAIDASPARKETYADALALLVTHGHLPEALDAYHRALGREEVTEYLKTYFSFWVVGLARRAGKEPDPLALNFLRTLRGDAWYVQLAQPVLGEGRFETLEPRAKKIGQRAELYFYWADALLARGELARARELWRKVIDTKMMAFFEYDMAHHNLTVGPPKVLDRPVDRQPLQQAQSN